MGRALASPAASTADSPAALRTPTSCRRSSDQHRIAAPPPACLNPQSEPHVVPSRRVPRASSLALARIRQRLSDCRIFTPAQPNHSVASSEGFLLRRLHIDAAQTTDATKANDRNVLMYFRPRGDSGVTSPGTPIGVARPGTAAQDLLSQAELLLLAATHRHARPQRRAFQK